MVMRGGKTYVVEELPDAPTRLVFVMEAFVPVDAPLELELGDMAWVVRVIVCDGCVVDFGGFLSFCCCLLYRPISCV